MDPAIELHAPDCPHCASGPMQEERYADQVKCGRAVLRVEDLVHWKCSQCEGVVVTSDQMDKNQQRFRDAEALKSAYTTPAMLREFRQRYGVSQRQAGQLVGAGAGAFGRYEGGGRLATPTAKLIRVALAFPEVAAFLAREEKMSITMPDIDVGGAGHERGPDR
jgi:putative zinc finger/helix-turn-helix YgiT family protein